MITVQGLAVDLSSGGEKKCIVYSFVLHIHYYHCYYHYYY